MFLITQFSPPSCYFLFFESEIFSFGLCSQIPSIYVPPLAWKTIFQTHAKQNNNHKVKTDFSHIKTTYQRKQFVVILTGKKWCSVAIHIHRDLRINTTFLKNQMEPNI